MPVFKDVLTSDENFKALKERVEILEKELNDVKNTFDFYNKDIQEAIKDLQEATEELVITVLKHV